MKNPINTKSIKRVVDERGYEIYRGGLYFNCPDCYPMKTDRRCMHANFKYGQTNLYNDSVGHQIGFSKLWP